MVVDKTPFLKIKARYEAGERIAPYIRKSAEEVLGERFLRQPKRGQRPDARDRAAGDDSFDDDEA
ncbi:MAG TPA: hypothetical protein VK165_20190 [Azonexus sp.]|nr:hypothetical protein [Azonexus sp.]